MVRALRSLGADAGWFLPSRLEDGYGISDATVGEAGRPRRPPADHRRLRDHGRRRRSRAAIAAGLDVVVVGPPCAARGRRAPGVPDRPPGRRRRTRAPSCAAPASRTSSPRRSGAASAAEDLELVALATVADLVPLRRRESTARARGAGGAREHRATGLAGADGGLAGRSERARRARARLPARAADQRRREDAAGRRGTRAAADRGFRARPRDRARARRKSTSSGVRSSSGSVGRRRSRSRRSASGTRMCSPREGWHPGVIGIVASRIVERYHRPAILIALDGDRPGHGSGRSIPGFDLLGALHGAAGTLESLWRPPGGGRADRRRRTGSRRSARRSSATPKRVLTAELLEPVERIDAIVSGSELGLGLAEELQLLEPCGLGNPARTAARPGRPVRRSAADGGGGAPRPLLGDLGRGQRAGGRVRMRADARRRSRRGARRDLPARAQRLERRRRAAARAPPQPAVQRRRGSRWSASRPRGSTSPRRSASCDRALDGARRRRTG